MNRIYGANNKKQFIELQGLNNGKRKVNYSMMLIGDGSFDIYKVHALEKNFKFPRKKFHNFFGISEPKSKDFIPEYMSPVIDDNWIVGCCGEITNRSNFINETENDPVSLLISDILFELSRKSKKNEVKIINEMLSYIEGRYSMWLHNISTKNTFIVKCNQALYANIYENTFSSVQFKDSEELEDGEIFQLTREGITNVSSFNCDIC
jgi:hypothetical protein